MNSVSYNSRELECIVLITREIIEKTNYVENLGNVLSYLQHVNKIQKDRI